MPQPNGQLRVIYPDIPDNYRSRAGAGVAGLHLGTHRRARARGRRPKRTATGTDLEAARLDLRLEVARAYWALVTARETVRVLEARAGRRPIARSTDVRTRVEAGFLPPNDVSRSEAQRARAGAAADRGARTRRVA